MGPGMVILMLRSVKDCAIRLSCVRKLSRARNRGGHRGQTSISVGAIANVDGGQLVKVDAVQMPAVIVNVVFPSDFTVCGNVDAGIDLIQNDLTGSAHKDGLSLVPECPQCLHVVRFGIGPYRGRQ